MIVGNCHPIAGAEAQELVTADAIDGKRCLSAAHRDVAHDRDDRPIVARPLEARRAKRAAAVNFDAIKTVLKTAIPRGRRQDAWIVRCRWRDGAAGQPSGGGRLADRHAAGCSRHWIDAHLPDRLPPCRRIGAAESGVEQFGILDIGNFAIPHIEIDHGIAGGGKRGWRKRRQLRREERLMIICCAILGEVFDLDAVDIEAPGADRKIGGRPSDPADTERVRDSPCRARPEGRECRASWCECGASGYRSLRSSLSRAGHVPAASARRSIASADRM